MSSVPLKGVHLYKVHPISISYKCHYPRACLQSYTSTALLLFATPQSRGSATGTSPSSLSMRLVFRTFPLTLSILRNSCSALSTLLPFNHAFHEDFDVGMKSSVWGMRRIWYCDEPELESNHVSNRSRLRKFDLKRLSRKSPRMGTMPTNVSMRTLRI